MKLPRDVSADRLIRVLRSLGYQVVRQRGSHVRLKHDGPPPHLITVPHHDPLKVGTLQAILSEVAQTRSTSLSVLAEML